MRGTTIAIGAGLVIGLGAMPAAAGAAEHADPQGAESAPPEWVAPLDAQGDAGIGGVAFVSRTGEAGEDGPTPHRLRLELEPAPGQQAYAAYLREGRCGTPGEILVKAEPDLNASGELASVMPVPAGALAHAAGGELPDRIVQVLHQDGTVVACGRLLPAGAQEAAQE